MTEPAAPQPAADRPPAADTPAQPATAQTQPAAAQGEGTAAQAPAAARPPAADTPAQPATARPAEAATQPDAAQPDAARPAPADASAPAEARTSDITAGQGGVMTDEVGVITGDLTLRTELSAGQVVVRAQYKDADEWYAVTGAKAQLKDPADLDAVHTVVVGILHRPEG